MIYLVTKQRKLFDSDLYKVITEKESLDMMHDWKVVQYDSETTGRDPHVNDILCIQFGNDSADARIIVDTESVDRTLYRDVLESKTVIGQNLKFDLAFLYNSHIKPRKVYDTMIVEQLLHLGYPAGSVSYSLKAIADRRLGINIDKTVRGEIIWRGLDEKTILYAAGDVTYLEKIAQSQIKDLREEGMINAAKLECDVVPSVAYMEWCGIMLDENKWTEKMKNDCINLQEATKALDNFVVHTPSLAKFVTIDRQGDLFSGFNLEPQINVNWSSSRQVIEVVKILGFDTTIKDKKTGEDKDSVLEKQLSVQKGINDEFLRLYLGKGQPGDKDYYAGYTGSAKVVSSFGQGHLDAINPNTKRLHTSFKQLGASSGRFSCGSNQPNIDLAKLKKLSVGRCKYLNIQQLPSDEATRSAFVAPKGYKFVSADFSAEELSNFVIYIKSVI